MSATTPITLPNFTEELMPSFVDSVVESLLDHYLPADGSYAENHLTDWGAQTRLFMPLGETLYRLATDAVPKKDHSDSIAMSSTRLLMHIPAIAEKLRDKLPERLEPINWCSTQLDFSLYNEKQFRGKNEDGEPMFGAPTCMFVLHLKPVTGRVPVCKNHAPKKAMKPVEEQEETEQNTNTSAKKPFTVVKAAHVKQTYAKTAASGEGTKPFTGRKSRT